jgi:putative aldouronate transport system substrate-binding protein
MKKFLSAVLLLAMLFSVSSSSVSFAEATVEEAGLTLNTQSLPIVTDPLTLEIALWYATGFTEPEDMVVLQDLQKTTGITFEYRVFTEVEKVKLMYAARDYPDISWRLDGSDPSKLDAIEAGDVICLDEYLQFAPNVTAMFEQYPSVKLQVINPNDGKIYSFPFFEDWDSTFGLRDVAQINKQWLDELGLEMPTTLEELLGVLREFKANAGTGTIPENVIPYYMYYPSAIGSIFDFVCYFGVYAFDSNWEAVIDRKYYYQAINPDIKEPIKYLAMMYKEGLLNQNIFTDGWTEYYNIFLSENPVAGITAGYANTDTHNYAAGLGGAYYPLGPIDTGNGKKPLVRTQAFGASWPTNYMLYSNNEHPIASVLLANYMCEKEESYTLRLGAKGTFWDYVDGVPTIMNYGSMDYPAESSLNNMGFTMCNVNELYNPSEEVEGSRDWAIKNVYDGYTATYTYPKLPTVSLGEFEDDRLSDLRTDLSACVDTHLAAWITGQADVEQEWEAYIAEMESYGVLEYIELQQKKLDTAYALGD